MEETLESVVNRFGMSKNMFLRRHRSAITDTIRKGWAEVTLLGNGESKIITYQINRNEPSPEEEMIKECGSIPKWILKHKREILAWMSGKSLVVGGVEYGLRVRLKY